MHNRKPGYGRVSVSTRAAVLCAAGLTVLAPCSGHAQAAAQSAPEQSSTGLTLQDCLNLAAKNNPVTEQAQIGVDQAKQQFKVAKQALLPSFNMGVDANATTNPDVSLAADDNTLVSNENQRAMADVTYTLSDAGHLRFLEQAAQYQIAASTARGSADTLTLLQSTSLAYYNALHARDAVETGETNVKTAQINLDQTKARFQIGTVTRSDILTAQSALDAAQSTLEMLKLDAQDANAALASLIGSDPSTTLALAAAQPPDWSLVDDLDNLLGKATGLSPLKQQIDASRAAAEANLKAVKAGYKPRLRIVGEVGELAVEGTGSSWAYEPYAFIGADLTAPIFNGAAEHAEEQVQIDAIKSQDVALRQLIVNLKQQIAVGVSTYHTSLTRVQIARDTVDNASQAYQFSQDKYAAGKATEQDVVQALQLLALAREQLQQSIDERDTAAQNLRWLTGLDMPGTYVDVGSINVPASGVPIQPSAAVTAPASH